MDSSRCSFCRNHPQRRPSMWLCGHVTRSYLKVTVFHSTQGVQVLQPSSTCDPQLACMGRYQAILLSDWLSCTNDRTCARQGPLHLDQNLCPETHVPTKKLMAPKSLAACIEHSNIISSLSISLPRAAFVAALDRIAACVRKHY